MSIGVTNIKFENRLFDEYSTLSRENEWRYGWILELNVELKWMEVNGKDEFIFVHTFFTNNNLLHYFVAHPNKSEI